MTEEHKVQIEVKKCFWGNPIVEYILVKNHCGETCDLNKIWARAINKGIKRKYMRQFYRLISYSVDGYNEIDFTRLPTK